MIRYNKSLDIEARIAHISNRLGFSHLHLDRVVCVRSKGSAAERTIARCHGLPRIMQAALGVQPYYVIEVISERFDGMSEADQTKTLIHELLHIPKAFGGGFKGHGYVSRDRVERLYRSLQATSGLAA